MYRGKQADPFYHSGPWLDVREVVLERDHHICQVCLRAFRAGKMRRPRQANTVHHIIPRKERPDLALDPSNLESICAICHNREHPEKGRSRGADKPENARPHGTARVIKIGG